MIMEQSFDFEKTLDRLNEIVKLMESKVLPLQEGIALFEEGSVLIKKLETALSEAEKKIASLIKVEK
jgi:exodeoxyribonuclease VII small subunit